MTTSENMKQPLPSGSPAGALLSLSLALLLLAACVTNPATGRRQLILVSGEDEVRLGQQAHPGILEEYGEAAESDLSRMVDRVGREIAAASERPDLPYRFTLLDAPIVNAFALPGGPVYATRGLLAYAEDEAELAGVLGHEVGHVVGRHGAEQMSRSQALQTGLGILSAAEPRAAGYGDLLGTSAGLLLLRFGRDAEREADKLGVRYLGKTGYDPYGLPRYLGVLDRLSGDSGTALPNWLSTHPDPGRRVEATRELAAIPARQQLETGRKALDRREEYLAALDGLVWGDDPRDGFSRGRTFHHPRMRFRLDAPEGWKGANTRQFVAWTAPGESPAGRIVLRLAGPVPDGGPSAHADALRKKNPGVLIDGSAARIGGLDAWVGSASTGGTPLAIAWIAHEGRLFELIGARSASATDAVRAEIDATLRSFRPEKDSDVLSVEPVVLKLETTKGAGGKLASLCRARRAELGADCATLARLNRLDQEAPLEPGRRVKIPTRQHPLYP